MPSGLQGLGGVRAAWTLNHAQLLGDLNPAVLWSLTPWLSEPLGEQAPDLVILPLSIEPWMFPPAGRQPVWWSTSQGIAVYAPHGAVDPVMPPPPDAAPMPGPPPVSVQVSDVRATDGWLSFTVTIEDLAPERWTGQDWVLTAGDASPWAIPTHLEPDRRTPVPEQWFSGQMVSGRGTTTHHYTFDAPHIQPGSAAERSGNRGGGLRRGR